MKICIFGASSRSLEREYYDAAEELGRLIGARGDELVFGGGAEGLMGACARGTHASGGKICGIAPRFFDEPGILYEHCTELIFTDTMRERKRLMQENSDSCVVLPGGIGTLEEFFELLTLKQLGQESRAIALLNTLGSHEPMLAMLRDMVRRGLVAEGVLGLYSVAASPAEALEQLDGYVPTTGGLNRLSDYNK